MAVAALGMLLTSCAKDDSFAPADQETIVSFSINTPEITTRYGEGEQATQLHWAVYDAGINNRDSKGYLANISSDVCGTETMVNGSARVEISLVDGRSYDIIFWAQNADAPYEVEWTSAEDKTAAAAKVSYAEGANLVANNENMDAFYASISLNDIKGSISQSVSLTRPFAQLNIATADTAQAAAAGINVAKTGVKVTGVYTSFGLKNGDILGDATTLTFSTSAKAEGTISANDKSYDMLAMNYILVKDKSLVDVTLMLQEANVITSVMARSYTTVPVQRNYRTNIVGNILTSDADFDIELNPDFTEGDLLKWDGEMLSKPTYDETTDTYRISHGAELAWIAALVNGTLPTDMRSGEGATVAANSLEGATIVLEHDIDLGGKEWTPIGTDWTNAFAGTFNGNGYAIRNIKISKATNNGLAALFGTIRSALIQNLVIENADITCEATTGENHFFGAGLVSVAYVASTIDNVIVKDSKIQGNNKVGGLVGYNANNGFIAKSCKVIGTTVESVNTEDGGSVGGLIGSVLVDSDKNNAGNIELLIENCHIEGSTIKGYNSANAGKRASSAFIGVLYVQNNDWELNINGCSVDAATTFEELNTECTYTSPYGEFIGGLRADDGKSCKVIIDGYEIIANGVGVKENDEAYYILNANGLYWVANEVNKVEQYAANIFRGKTVYLTKDIDLGGNEWIPIGDFGNTSNQFDGTFDGQNHTVSNFKISKVSDKTDTKNRISYGFFGNVNGTIKNLTIANASINVPFKFIGGLVGRLNGGLIDNCHVKNSSVKGTSWTIGGIVAQVNAGNITNCSIEGTSVTGTGAVAAIAGIQLNKSERTIENCTVKNCTIAQEGSSGATYDTMFGVAVGATYSDSLILNLNNIKVENNTIKGEASDVLVGYIEPGDKVYIDGELVATLQPVVDGDGNPVAGIMTDESGNYYITAAGGLSYIGTNLAANDGFAGKTITLNSDITLTEEFAPIAAGTRSGSSAVGTGFKGTFDGNGKTIDGLEITNSSNEDNAIGFFGIIDGGEVKNVNFTNVDINIPNGKNVGTVAGLVANGGKISGVTVSGKIEGKQGTGGIAGRILAHGTIENCTNNATVSTSSYNIGGIVGAAYYTKAGCTMSIKNCTNNGAVKGSFNGAGGIAGLSVADIEGCTNTGNVSGKGEGVGGIAGEQSHAGSIIGCRNEGNITNSTSSVTGGIVGWIRYNGNSSDYPVAEIIEIKNNTNTGEVLAAKYVGGIVGTIYNYGFIENNKNEAPKITATADTDTVNGKAAGIVGYALCADNQGQDGLTAPLSIVVKNNTSATTAENILGAVTNLIINQGGTGITVEGNTPAGI